MKNHTPRMCTNCLHLFAQMDEWPCRACRSLSGWEAHKEQPEMESTSGSEPEGAIELSKWAEPRRKVIEQAIDTARTEEDKAREHQRWLHTNFGRPTPPPEQPEPSLSEQLRDLRVGGVEWVYDNRRDARGAIYHNGTQTGAVRVTPADTGYHCTMFRLGAVLGAGIGATPGEAVQDAIDSAQQHADDIIAIVRTMRGDL